VYIDLAVLINTTNDFYWHKDFLDIYVKLIILKCVNIIQIYSSDLFIKDHLVEFIYIGVRSLKQYE
jgi:hypothetical protein